MTYEPFKCPICAVWWRGETHKCEPVPAATHNHTHPATIAKTSTKPVQLEFNYEYESKEILTAICKKCSFQQDFPYKHNCGQKKGYGKKDGKHNPYKYPPVRYS